MDENKIWSKALGFRHSRDSASMADHLDAYIKAKHTQDECIGYIDGFKDGIKLKNKHGESRYIVGSVVGILAGIAIGYMLFS